MPRTSVSSTKTPAPSGAAAPRRRARPAGGDEGSVPSTAGDATTARPEAVQAASTAAERTAAGSRGESRAAEAPRQPGGRRGPGPVDEPPAEQASAGARARPRASAAAKGAAGGGNGTPVAAEEREGGPTRTRTIGARRRSASTPEAGATEREAGARRGGSSSRAGATRTAGARPSGARAARDADSYDGDERFLAEQRRALESERATYLEQARSLREEAESLVEEMEPGDVQFDEESGEGGTVTVDRERDLALSAQALAAVEEIEHALAKIAHGGYGRCESCGRLITKERLRAIPYARLCIECKAGGLSRR
jgi:DnaK suppressor protein